MQPEQEILNKLAIEYLSKTPKFVKERRVKLLARKLIKELQVGNSNATYEELQAILRLIGEESITTEKSIKELGGMCYQHFRANFSKKIKRIKPKGQLSKLDTDILKLTKDD